MMTSRNIEFLRPSILKLGFFVVLFCVSMFILSKRESVEYPVYNINGREMVTAGGLTGHVYIGFPMRLGMMTTPTNAFEEDPNIIVNFDINLAFWYLVACFIVSKKPLRKLSQGSLKRRRNME